VRPRAGWASFIPQPDARLPACRAPFFFALKNPLIFSPSDLMVPRPSPEILFPFLPTTESTIHDPCPCQVPGGCQNFPPRGLPRWCPAAMGTCLLCLEYFLLPASKGTTALWSAPDEEPDRAPAPNSAKSPRFLVLISAADVGRRCWWRPAKALFSPGVLMRGLTAKPQWADDTLRTWSGDNPSLPSGRTQRDS